MKAIIISIGNELLSGHENTNASWIAQDLSTKGINVTKIFAIADIKEDIMNTLDISFSEADIIVMTGGLGPTKDDITKNTLCEYFKCGLRFSESAYRNVEKIFKDRGFAVTEINRKQPRQSLICWVLLPVCGLIKR